MLHSGPFSAPLSSAYGLLPTDHPLPRWSFGLEGTLTTSGLTPGLLLLPPPWRPFGAELEAELGTGWYPERPGYVRVGFGLRL